MKWARPIEPVSTITAARSIERTRLILKVHPSNFRISGFTESPPA